MTASTDVLPIHCFSHSEIFEEPIPYRFIPSGHAEFFDGLEIGEYASIMDSPLYVIQIQPSMLQTVEIRDMYFKSTEDMYERILAMRDYNSTCMLAERRRFDTEIPIVSSYEYTLVMIDPKDTIYTRHPATYEITRHEYPYSDLPRVSTSIHPVFASFFAYRALLYNQDAWESLIFRAGCWADELQPSAEYLSFKRSFSQSPPVTLPSLTSGRSVSLSHSSAKPSTPAYTASSRSAASRKRKRLEDPPAASKVTSWLKSRATEPAIEVVDQAHDDLNNSTAYSVELVKTVDAALKDEPAWRAVCAKRPKSTKPRRVRSQKRMRI